MFYRILESLRFTGSSKRLEAGTIDSLKRVSPEAIAMLIAKKRIAEVRVPPLAVILSEERAAVYAKQGIEEVYDFEVIPDEVLAEIAEPEGSPEPDPAWSHAKPWDAEHVYELDVDGDPRSEEDEALLVSVEQGNYEVDEDGLVE